MTDDKDKVICSKNSMLKSFFTEGEYFSDPRNIIKVKFLGSITSAILATLRRLASHMVFKPT